MKSSVTHLFNFSLQKKECILHPVVFRIRKKERILHPVLLSESQAHSIC